MQRRWDIRFRTLNFELRTSFSQRALTLVELLIVIIVIGILVSSILVAGSGLINKGRTNNTQALLQIVADAVEEFKREQTAKPTITRARQPRQGAPPGVTVNYSDRYGLYPPDELEVFSSQGLPGSVPPASPKTNSLAAGGAVIVPAPPWPAMRFYKDSTDADTLENRDQAAMIVAIETLSESASTILDRIPDKNRSAGVLNTNGEPALFLDRADLKTTPPKPNDKWDANDHQIRLIIDDWGNPISYLAQRDWQPASGTFTPIDSKNHAAWNEPATELIRLNGGQPIIMSYGPNGKDQLTKEAMEPNAKASLVGDFESDTPVSHVVDDPMNDDNVYSNPALKEKLAKGIKP